MPWIPARITFFRMSLTRSSPITSAEPESPSLSPLTVLESVQTCSSLDSTILLPLPTHFSTSLWNGSPLKSFLTSLPPLPQQFILIIGPLKSGWHCLPLVPPPTPCFKVNRRFSLLIWLNFSATSDPADHSLPWKLPSYWNHDVIVSWFPSTGFYSSDKLRNTRML